MQIEVCPQDRPWYEKALVVPSFFFGAGVIAAPLAMITIPILIILSFIVGLIACLVAIKYIINFSIKIMHKGIEKCKHGKWMSKTT